MNQGMETGYFLEKNISQSTGKQIYKKGPIAKVKFKSGRITLTFLIGDKWDEK